MAGVSQFPVNFFPYLRDAGRILDLIPQGRTNAPAVHYFTGTTAASAAAAVSEGAAKPESTPVWTEVTATSTELPTTPESTTTSSRTSTPSAR
jgi:hypothetical protein